MRDLMAVIKALADENRVRVLLAVQGRELCVCQIVELLGLAPSTVSKHLSILHQARLLESRKDGRWMFYRAAGEDSPVEAREIAQKRQRLEREAQNRRSQRGGTLEDISRALKEGEVTNLRIIIKADQGGPAEALADALAQLSTSEVRVDVVHRGVGAITESDVLLAKASGAIVLGFHVRPDSNARAAAERESVDVRTYRIIYEAVEDVRNALEGLLKPEEKETVLGEAEVLQLFKVSKVGTIAGCTVRSGTIQRTAKVRVIRDGAVVYTGGLASLKRFKDDVREVREGLECGIGIENFNDLKVGDRIESFRMEEVKRTLQPAAAASH